MMDAPSRLCLLVALVLAWSTSTALGQPAPGPSEAEVAQQLKRLDQKNKKTERLRALNWLSANARDKQAAVAIPAMEKSIRDDPEADVRQEAVNTLGQLTLRRKMPCPLIILEALHDPEDFVRYQADVSANLFKTFAPGAADVLFRGVTADNAELRSSSLRLLASVAGKDPKALAAMEKAKTDKVLDVRHTAHLALFRATNKLNEYLPYLIRIREDPASFLSPGPEDSELAKQERTYRNMILLGIGIQVIDWSETRADELAEVLFKLLKDESAVMRRGAARLIGAAAVKMERPVARGIEPLTAPNWIDGSLIPLFNPEADPGLKKESKPKEAPQPSKVAKRLEKLQVKTVLGKLRDEDPDRSVRDAARSALDRLASVLAKKP